MSSFLKSKYLFLFFFALYFNQSFCQNLIKEIDSIKTILKTEKNNSERVKVLALLTKNYTRISIDSSQKYGELGLKIPSEEVEKENLADLYISVGGVYFRKGEPKKSKHFFFKALNLREELKDTLGIALAKANLVSYYGQYKKIDSAMIYAIEAVDVIENKGNKRQANMLKGNIGALYQLKYNYDKALEYYLEALEYSKKVKFHNFTTNLYSNIAIIYDYKNETQKSIANNLKSVEYAKKTSNNNIITASLNNLGSVYFENGEIKKSLKTFEEALFYAKKYNSITETSNVKYNLAKTYFKLKKFDKAEKNFLEVKEHYAKTNDKRKLSIINENLAYINAIKRNLNEMLAFKSEADSIRDSFFRDTSDKKMEELETKYQTEKKEKELLQTQAEKATTELKLSKQKNLTYGLVGGLGLLLLLGYSLFQRNKRKHQLAISQQKEAGLQAIIQAEENERTKIARELHDGVVQQIGSVILKSRNLLKGLNLQDKPESKDLLKSLENSNQDLRTISHQMMPRALSELGIVAALEDLLNGSLGQTNIKHNFEHFNISERLKEKVEVTIYRVTQELVNNIIKHSEAKEVSVQLFKTGSNVVLIVEDNGVGISKNNTKKGIGLLNISSRLDMVSGEVNFEPSPQSGTLVTVKIPV